MRNQQSSFSSEIQEKRTTFANEIRRAKRSSIIGEKRKVLYQQHLKILAQSKGTVLQNISSEDLLNQLQPGPYEEQLLHQLLLKLQSPNENPRMIIEQIFNSGKYCYLIENLNTKKLVDQTLSIFSVIMARPDFQKTTFLVNKGFFEILIQLFGEQIDLAGRIANIAGNICIDSDDYCDWFLENHVHILVFDVFHKLYEKFHSNQTIHNPQKELQMIIWMLAIIVGTQDSTLDFTAQYDDIMNFSIQLLEKRIMIKHAIMIFYELAAKNPQRVEAMVNPVINQLIEEQTGSSDHFDQLFMIVCKLTPGNFRYDLLFYKALLGNYDKARRALRIIEKLDDSQFLKQIIKDEAWWERILIKLQANTHESRFALSIIRKHNINFQCVWNYVSEYLDDSYNKEAINQILLFLKDCLNDASPSMYQLQYLLERLEMSRIVKKIIKLYDKEHSYLTDKLAQVIHLIERAAQNLKDMHDLEIEI